MNYPAIVKDILRYRYQIREFKHYNNAVYNFSLFKYFFRWRFFRTQSDSLKYRIPWITFPAIHYLERYLKKEMQAFEYGSGASTLFFADRIQKLISIEHDGTWFEKISDKLRESDIQNVDLRKITPSKEDNIEENYTSQNENYPGLSFKNYAQEISHYPDNYFDVVLIDGRARTGCFLQSISKIKTGGLLIWDNTERSRYRISINKGFKSLRKIELPGPTPYSKYFTLTSIFVKE
jgi:hypothetical protein